MSARAIGFAAAVVGTLLAVAAPALANPPTATRDEVLARGKGVIGFSYWWGHGRWSTSSVGHGSCSGSCPSCSHSGSYGADCSGFVAKAWQVPSAINVTTDSHPYSTYNFKYESQHWSSISRSSAKKADSFVYHSGGAGHIFLYESGDPWGWVTAIECKGCSYGCVRDGRSVSSSYVARRRDNIVDAVDSDGDGVIDSKDNCKTVKNSSQTDTDKDGKGDACDTDDDNDGVLDAKDNCDTVKNVAQTDTDKDGKGDACDTDDDGDGVADTKDNCDLVQNKSQIDTDKDGKGDACDTDDDADGILDSTDNCPLVKNAAQTDSDEDGKGDACEVDDDADGVIDADDNCPGDANADQLDTDKDGKGDACDDDDDADGVPDASDNCPETFSKDQRDTDKDGQGDACDPDIDGDGLLNAEDLCPRVPSQSRDDSDDDGIGDECDDDVDGDGVFDAVDNCPTVANPDQKENADGKPEACANGDLGDPAAAGDITPGGTSADDMDGGCGCRTAPERGGSGLELFGLAGLILAAAARRRRSRH